MNRLIWLTPLTRDPILVGSAHIMRVIAVAGGSSVLLAPGVHCEVKEPPLEILKAANKPIPIDGMVAVDKL